MGGEEGVCSSAQSETVLFLFFNLWGFMKALLLLLLLLLFLRILSSLSPPATYPSLSLYFSLCLSETFFFFIFMSERELMTATCLFSLLYVCVS